MQYLRRKDIQPIDTNGYKVAKFLANIFNNTINVMTGQQMHTHSYKYVQNYVISNNYASHSVYSIQQPTLIHYQTAEQNASMRRTSICQKFC